VKIWGQICSARAKLRNHKQRWKHTRNQVLRISTVFLADGAASLDSRALREQVHISRNGPRMNGIHSHGGKKATTKTSTLVCSEDELHEFGKARSSGTKQRGAAMLTECSRRPGGTLGRRLHKRRNSRRLHGSHGTVVFRKANLREYVGAPAVSRLARGWRSMRKVESP